MTANPNPTPGNTMRELTAHAINPCNKALRIVADDGPGPGGASHSYEIIDASTENQSSDGGLCFAVLDFQNGPVGADGEGVKGITNESLLAVLIDRLQGFQAGPYACDENAHALGHAHNCLAALHERTKRREAAGVEGTMAKDPAPSAPGD